MYRFRKRFRTRKQPRHRRRNRMQTAASEFTKRKYTRVFDLIQTENGIETTAVISHIGGLNTFSGGTITLGAVDQFNQVQADMTLNQQFKITGVMWKAMFSTNTQDPSAVQWETAYSPTYVFNNQILSSSIQTLANYQTSSATYNQVIRRYFPTGPALRALGIDWCDTDEYTPAVSPWKGVSDPPIKTYGGQLDSNLGSSSVFKLNYDSNNDEAGNPIIQGKLQVTYYVAYKGRRGVSVSLVDNPPGQQLQQDVKV